MAKGKLYPAQRMTKIMEIQQLCDDSFTDVDFMQFVWELESCDEAVMAFGNEMMQCPVCFALLDHNGVMVHKQREEILN